MALIAGYCRADDNDDAKAVATVQTSVIRSGKLTDDLTVYGSVVAQPGASIIISQPIDVRIVHLRVAPGQSVARQTALIEVEPSLDTQLQWQDARAKLGAAEKNLSDVQQRFNLKLATNADLLQAREAAQSAQLTEDNLQQRGAGARLHSVLASGDSLVDKVDVREGQVVPAGTPLLELMPRKNLWARLGVEPSRVASLQINQGVRLFPADGSEPVAGKIRMIGQQVDPETRLAEIFVEPDKNAPLLFDVFVRGEVAIEHKPSLLVPRSSVLPDGDNDVLFTVKDEHAVKHTVKVESQNDTDAAISGEGLKPGDAVVVQGNLELDDGMAVTVEASK